MGLNFPNAFYGLFYRWICETFQLARRLSFLQNFPATRDVPPPGNKSPEAGCYLLYCAARLFCFSTFSTVFQAHRSPLDVKRTAVNHDILSSLFYLFIDLFFCEPRPFQVCFSYGFCPRSTCVLNPMDLGNSPSGESGYSSTSLKKTVLQYFKISFEIFSGSGVRQAVSFMCKTNMLIKAA